MICVAMAYVSLAAWHWGLMVRRTEAHLKPMAQP